MNQYRINHALFCRRKSQIALIFVLVLAFIPYCRLLSAYFLGYDDFIETHRSAFEDTRQPSRIFTTGHFHALKYRPLNRAFNFATYHLGKGKPWPFRARNVFFHLLNTAIIFYLGTLLFGSILTSGLASILFAWNPLAHQAVAGAVMTNSAAAAFALLAVALGINSYHARQSHSRQLILAIAFAWIGTLLYEADVVIPGILILYWVFDTACLQRPRISRTWIWTLLLLTAYIVSCTIILRSLVLHRSNMAIAPLSLIAHNGIIYAVAMLLPVDPLLVNHWFGTPLAPALISGISRGNLVIISVCGTCTAVVGFTMLFRSFRKNVRNAGFVHCAFLISGAFLAILPLLIYNEHPSETYLYLPLSFLMLYLGRLLFLLRDRSPIAFVVVTTLLLTSFASATWERSIRVISSAAIAERILLKLPTNSWRQGSWTIRLANAPGNKLPPRYGLYDYAGLDTIGVDDGVMGVQDAIQLRIQGENVSAVVLEASEMSKVCTREITDLKPCFWIYPNGDVHQYISDIPEISRPNAK